MKIAVTAGVVVGAALMGAAAADPSLTIYNQNFAVVRDTVRLDLKQGVNHVSVTEMTAQLEPDSVVLRNPAGKRQLRILEQNYRNDPVSQELLLSLNEGKVIDFLVRRGDVEEIVRGKIIRSGFIPRRQPWRGYQQPHPAATQPIIEVKGKLRFGLPGQPLFPALADDTVLKPTLYWVIETDQPGRLDAELAYITGGMSWQASYNLVAPEKGDRIDIVGWVTMDNQTGKTFQNASIRLMAGDVSKLQPQAGRPMAARAMMADAAKMGPPVTEKSFDEYHLYTIQRRTTLRDRETKQVEFLRATDVESKRLYIYDGARINWNQIRYRSAENLRDNRNYGTQCNTKVWVMREFENSEENGLGIPLPRGRVRFYRKDTPTEEEAKNGQTEQVEFVGENMIDHTPKDETVRIYTGDAFDIVGERKQVGYKVDTVRKWLDETIEITIKNHKEEEVEVRAVEHLYRWSNWEIRNATDEFEKTESRTIEFRVTIPRDGKKVIKYTAHYTW